MPISNKSKVSRYNIPYKLSNFQKRYTSQKASPNKIKGLSRKAQWIQENQRAGRTGRERI